MSPNQVRLLIVNGEHKLEICTILGAQVMCTSVYAIGSNTLNLRADLAYRIRPLESIDFLTSGADARDRGNIAQLELKP